MLSQVLVLQEDAFWGRGWGVWVNSGGLRVCGGNGHSIHVQILTALLCIATVHTKSPPLSIVQRFIHLLEQSQHDFWEESEVLRLQEEVVKRIRANRQLENDLDLMDIKIGLLVKNRITLQVQRVGEDLILHSMALQLGRVSASFFERLEGLGSTGVPLALPEMIRMLEP